ncbi:MAG: GNAT family N-acetyltransferase [Hamadaea sp.]|uniref:GNAT family N-acetyltransferase n=1 Tax=Hamadaea sp. TaxID=2024425 RepID=UPI00181CD015|nr:GNAT family N-acetyltransferase [Hamadaea sp.]NUR71890.1 GNAT family N-acetyltransferase [Hamadaea sp.]NUT19910.1 GNAT family N-acetyltransferase [Hamadaea sp.]
MITPTLTSRSEFLAATGGNPFVALTTSARLSAYHRKEAWVWVSDGPWGVVTAGLGAGADALALLADLHAAGLTEGGRLHAPRVSRDAVLERFAAARFGEWDQLWSTTPPPVVPDEEQVEPLPADAAAEINALLDAALPESSSRPGDPGVRGWHGIWESDRLVAVAADRSANGVGLLSAIAVAPDHQGRGLGAAVTAALTRRLFEEYATVSLAVESDNARAIKLYERLGYTSGTARTSFDV